MVEVHEIDRFIDEGNPNHQDSHYNEPEFRLFDREHVDETLNMLRKQRDEVDDCGDRDWNIWGEE